MMCPKRFLTVLEVGSQTNAHEIATELEVLARREASGEKVLNDRSQISELSLFDAALRACDARLLSLPFGKREATAFGIAETYHPSKFTDETLRVMIMQFMLRYVLMHSVNSFSTESHVEKPTFASLSENGDSPPYASYGEAADRVCSELHNRMDDRTRGRFFAAATIILCRYPMSEPIDAYHRLLRTATAERVQYLYREEIRRCVLVPAIDDAPIDDTDGMRWRQGLVEWTVRQCKAPMPDKLYHLCTELLLLSKFVPTSWGASLAEGIVERESAAFQRNPATGVLAHCAPDRASDVRAEVQSIMTRMGEVYRRRKKGAVDITFELELHWEFGVACLQYACLQECDLDWMNRFYVDDAMDAQRAFEHMRAHRSRSGVAYAPALVHSNGVWCFKRTDRDAPERLAGRAELDAWSAIGLWCGTVLAEMKGVPCRAKNIRNVLVDIRDCGEP
ncbi:hypothetical protein CYMTET_3852 [Cymbomonas tetramitiformis]|uniref:Uncharacterized protein n=1 Tax=Cymbomonas tetramitiformis TaxID=36881 RepID=A0AAE0LL14_9CHLO|nr:hypothetical protein CYMTET_3852 [Cymbomonas tetramitiformis]